MTEKDQICWALLIEGMNYAGAVREPPGQPTSKPTIHLLTQHLPLPGSAESWLGGSREHCKFYCRKGLSA